MQRERTLLGNTLLFCLASLPWAGQAFHYFMWGVVVCFVFLLGARTQINLPISGFLSENILDQCSAHSTDLWVHFTVPQKVVTNLILILRHHWLMRSGDRCGHQGQRDHVLQLGRGCWIQRHAAPFQHCAEVWTLPRFPRLVEVVQKMFNDLGMLRVAGGLVITWFWHQFHLRACLSLLQHTSTTMIILCRGFLKSIHLYVRAYVQNTHQQVTPLSARHSPTVQYGSDNCFLTPLRVTCASKMRVPATNKDSDLMYKMLENVIKSSDFVYSRVLCHTKVIFHFFVSLNVANVGECHKAQWVCIHQRLVL